MDQGEMKATNLLSPILHYALRCQVCKPIPMGMEDIAS